MLTIIANDATNDHRNGVTEMADKITPTMQKALDACPLHYTRWGSSVMGSNFPKGVTMATIDALRKRNLINIKMDGAFNRTVTRKD